MSSFLDKLERGVLDEAVPLTNLLRQVVVIGGRASSPALREWALRELQGYSDSQVELPDYRKLACLLQVDIRTAAGAGTQMTISTLDLPEDAQRYVDYEAPIPFSVGRIETLISRAAPGEPVKLTPPGAAELARLMTFDRREQGVVVDAVYWAVDVSALQDILDQLRTRLAQFVAELRSTMPPGEQDPTPAQVRQAVQHINITAGDHSPVTVTAPMAYTGGQGMASAGAPDPQARCRWFLWWRRP
ncbi:hypothetical protein [Streptomyces sp. NPDC002573]|uniref:AbiTii domain-containing protein n=1 Tax=Streptomyces sp. NPDC002573 TaxID=3364651 RepID=UPI0036C94D69